jgi:cytochrome c-type biogenesis protein CcmH
MGLWSLFAIMTLAASVAVLWPLIWSFAPQVGGNEAAVYKDQLAEIDRDVATGLIEVSEVEATRVEIGRRLLAAADGGSDLFSQADFSRRRVSVFVATVLVAMPLAAAALYSSLGSPWLGDFPMASRFRAVDATQARDILSAQVKEYLAGNPTDGTGWTMLAPELVRLGRYGEAIRAYRTSIDVSGDSAERRSDLGEALARAAGGVVTTEARAEFERAVAQNADDPKAGYFLRLAAEQDGRTTDAASIWRGMLTKAATDAPWRPLLQSSLARVSGPVAPALSSDVMAGARDMSEDQRCTTVRGMVDRLATRLKQNGDDVEGWVRLVQAYLVLGERDRAANARSEARQAVAGDAKRLHQLNDGLRPLGFDG